ncbi:phosphate ABC transporter permease subunit PstC [Nodosilinea sp. LEGE 07298]|uniref:phosphate ABC transporter permease subunit PstC n=1 Tax=Nodosilinea sp. LEGE 07298 TaxID=2777970 RepID=UPI00187FABC6|nr:phosphate ABC transporter permease subunit PstC [Nodosilinea sp. LEGE 07298]MBE9111947.1 phosphate ABC transporter permease subunit PstC [Nodosilinea sp. LEGE 07298]
MPTEFSSPPDQSSLWKPNRSSSRRVESIVRVVCLVFAAISILTTLGIVLTLIFETIDFFADPFFRQSLWINRLPDLLPGASEAQIQAVGDQIQALDPTQLSESSQAIGLEPPSQTAGFFYAITRFFTDTRWTPLFANDTDFGIFVLISATLMTTTIAMAVAVPLGLLIAIFLSEYAAPKLRQVLKPVLELLAGVPSVVFGYFALLTVTPFLQQLIPSLQGFNALSAGMVLGVSILPLVASLSEDAINAVPQDLRQGAFAMGATKRETIQAVVIPAALSGIVASIILAMSRAIGETMIVSLAAGQNPQPIDGDLGFINPLIPVMTMTAFIVQVSLGDAPFGSLAYKTIFAVGMTLFLITLALNIVSYWFVRRFREKYD